MNTWEEIEQEPEYAVLTPEDRVSLHDQWSQSILDASTEVDPEQIDSAGISRFVAASRGRRAALASGTPFDEQKALKEYQAQVAEQSARRQDVLKRFDELETAKFRAKDAAVLRGAMRDPLDRGMGFITTNEILDRPAKAAQEEYSALEKTFSTPQQIEEARAAREAASGERDIAVLDGEIVTDPALTLDSQKYREAIASSDASPEEKAKALADFSAKKAAFAKAALSTLQVAGESPIPGAKDFPTWEAALPPDEYALPPEEKALRYMREMKDRSGFRKLVSAVAQGALQGGTDVASQTIGLAALATNSADIARKAAEVAQGAQTLEDVQKLEGDKKAIGATTLGGVARMAVPIVPTIGAAALTGGGLPAAAALSGMQTAGAQFPSTFESLKEQGKTDEEAMSAARGAALLSGAFTTAITALGGATGVESLVRSGGEAAVRQGFLNAVKKVVGGALKEVPEELIDEAASRVIEQSTVDPNKPVTQIIDEFAATAPELAMQVALLGGGGEAVQAYRESRGAPAVATPEGAPVEVAPTGDTAPPVQDQIANAPIEVIIGDSNKGTFNPDSGVDLDIVEGILQTGTPEEVADLYDTGVMTLPKVVPTEGDPVLEQIDENVAMAEVTGLAPATAEALREATVADAEAEAEAEAAVAEEAAAAEETPSLPETGPPVVDQEAPAGAPVQAAPIQPDTLSPPGETPTLATEGTPTSGDVGTPPAPDPFTPAESPQTTQAAAETQTPAPSRKGAGAAGVVERQPTEGSIPVVETTVVQTPPVSSAEKAPKNQTNEKITQQLPTSGAGKRGAMAPATAGSTPPKAKYRQPLATPPAPSVETEQEKAKREYQEYIDRVYRPTWGTTAEVGAAEPPQEQPSSRLTEEEMDKIRAAAAKGRTQEAIDEINSAAPKPKATRKPKARTPVTEQSRAPAPVEEELAPEEAPRPLPAKYKPKVGDLVSGKVNGVDVVGTVTRVSGGGMTTVEYAPGKDFVTNNPVPAAQALAAAPKYQYTQEQNAAKAARLGLPSTPGVTENAGEVIRNTLVNISKDTRLSPFTRAVARALLSVSFEGVRLRIKADARSIPGLYTHQDGVPEITVNLRVVARGQLDAIGIFLHEALHHATMEKLMNPAAGEEADAVAAIDKIVQHVRNVAGPDTKFDYELSNTWEFVSALFTNQEFQNYLATVPAPDSPTGIAKFRSVLSDIFRRLAQLVTGQKVQKGSTMEQAIAATMVLFETPQRTGTAPITPPQPNERPIDIPERVRGTGTQVTQAESGGNSASVLARLDAGREAAVSAAVAENDWENYTPEQKVEALNAFIRSTYGAADYSSWAQLRDVSGPVFTRGSGDSASVRGSVGADGRLNLELTYDNTERVLGAVKAGVPARDLFAFSYDTAQEEIIHAADKIGAFQRWKAAGRPGSFVEFERGEAKETVAQVNQTRLALQNSDPAAAQKIQDAILASWNIYHTNDPVTGVAGLLFRLEKTKNDAALYLYELRRQLTQLKRQDFTTETGWQKFRRVLEKWLTDAINALRGVQDVFRSGMAGDLIQRQLADLEAALGGKPLPDTNARYANTTGTPSSKLSPDKARAILTKRFGKAGGKFVVGEFGPDNNIDWDARISDGNITLNLKYLNTEELLIAKAEHELAHAVFDDPAVQEEWRAISRTLSPTAREQMAARLKSLGYDDGVLSEEMLVTCLEEIRRNTPPAAWQRFIKAVKDALLRLFGIDVSQGDAERAAARIVAAGEAALARGLDPAVAAFGQSVSEASAARDAEYMAAVEVGDMEKAQRMVDEAAKAAGYSIGPMFHGGADGFNAFSFEKMGEQGTSEGMGFYFTNREQVARGYVKQQGGRLMRVWLKRGKRLNSKKITINKAQLAKVLKKIDPKGDDFLTNYGDVEYEGYSKVLNDAVSNLLDYSNSDVDLIGGIINSGASPQQLYQFIEEVTGKSGMVTTAEDGGWGEAGHVITVITSPQYVKLADPVTRDDAGNVIPLSQRFQSSSPDIRYSIHEQTETQFGRERTINLRPAAPQQETANKASAIIGEAIAKDPVNGRMNALLRFDSDTSIPLEVRAIGAAMLAEQVEHLNALKIKQGKGTIENTDRADDFVDRAISIVQRLGTELGRGLNIFNAFARLTPEGFIRRQMRQHAKGVDEAIRQNFEGDLRGDVNRAFLALPEISEAEALRRALDTLPNRVSRKAIERFNAKLNGPVAPGEKNPLSELIAKNVKSPVENFKEKLVELGVDPEIATALDEVSTKLRNELTEAARVKAVEKLLTTKALNKTAREKLTKVVRTILEAGKLGATDSKQFMDLFAKEFGLPPMTKEFRDEIKEMVKAINALPKGPARIDAMQALEEKLALWEGIKTRDVLMSTWYANILSGVSTQAVGLLYNNLNLLLKSVVTMLANPRSAKAFVKGALGEGLRTGLKEAGAALQGRGLYKVSKWGDKSIINGLELLKKQGPIGAAQWAAYLASAGTFTRRVFHLMAAVDALAWNTAREGHAYLAAHRALREELAGTSPTEEEFSRKFVEKLGGDAAQIEADMREARDQLIKAGAVPDLTTIDRMARQMRDDRRSEAGMNNRFADRVVVQQEPEGVGRLVSALISAIQKVNVVGAPVGQMLVPFNKIVSNLFEQALDYTPVGVFRAILGGHLTDVESWGNVAKGEVKFREKSPLFDTTERWERGITGAGATVIGFLLYSLAASMMDEDDEDVPFMIYAFGPSDKNKRSQMPKGWAPFTVKIGDVYYHYAEAPFGMMFAGIGSVLDAMRYEKMDDKSGTEKLTYIMMHAAKGFMTQGVLSSVDTALDVAMFKASDKKFADIPASAAKGAIPFQGLLSDISTLTDDRKIDGSTMKAALLRDIPWVKSYAGNPELNRFGEPVTFDGLPVVRRFGTMIEKNHVSDYLARNDLYIPDMGKIIEVGSYLPKDMKDRLKRRALEVSASENGMLTEPQAYVFKKRAGELTKVAVQKIMSINPPITNDVQRKNVQNLLNRQIEIARKRAMLEAVPIK